MTCMCCVGVSQGQRTACFILLCSCFTAGPHPGWGNDRVQRGAGQTSSPPRASQKQGTYQTHFHMLKLNLRPLAAAASARQLFRSFSAGAWGMGHGMWRCGAHTKQQQRLVCSTSVCRSKQVKYCIPWLLWRLRPIRIGGRPIRSIYTSPSDRGTYITSHHMTPYDTTLLVLPQV